MNTSFTFSVTGKIAITPSKNVKHGFDQHEHSKMTNTREIKSLTCYLVSQYHQANGHQSTILTEKESLQYQSLIGSLISTSSIKTKGEFKI